jgi:hemolysin activation/secretion protein
MYKLFACPFKSHQKQTNKQTNLEIDTNPDLQQKTTKAQRSNESIPPNAVSVRNGEATSAATSIYKEACFPIPHTELQCGQGPSLSCSLTPNHRYLRL